MKYLLQWARRPAHWSAFWMPQSGMRGGFLMGALAALLYAIVSEWLGLPKLW